MAAPETGAGSSGAGDDAANAPARISDPLTVLVCVVPLALIGELYRWAGRPLAGEPPRLLGDPLLAGLAGSRFGDWASLAVPLIALAIACIFSQIRSRRPWRAPGISTLALVLGWSVLWACARLAVALMFRAWRADRIIGDAGLALSGAVQEELLFRWALVGGLLLIGAAIGLGVKWRTVIAVVIGALFFSLAHTSVVNHHPGAEPFAWPAFAERSAAGLIYGAVFIRQGLAVSTWAHVIYNLAVMFALGA